MLRFRIQKALRKSYRQAAPSYLFKGYLWDRLADELPALTWQQRFGLGFRKVAYSLAITVPCLTFGTGAYAYTSPTVTEGTTLYPVKQQIERLEGTMAKTHEERAAFHLKMYERRLREAEYLKTDVQRFDRVLQAAEGEQTVSTTVIMQDLSGAEVRFDYEQRLQHLDARYEILRAGVDINGDGQPPRLPDPASDEPGSPRGLLRLHNDAL